MTMDTLHTPPRRSMLTGLLRLRCPRCREGRLFRTTFEMNDPCPACGLMLQREPGYFLGAMYFSYFMTTLVLSVVFWGGYLLLEWPVGWLAVLSIAVLLPLVPMIFRYSL